jgi:hypothetical protein
MPEHQLDTKMRLRLRDSPLLPYSSTRHHLWLLGFGALTGLVSAVGFLVAAVVNMALILPDSDSQHFRNLIVHSKINRYADYIKSGDSLRASVMAELIEKLGIPVNSLVAEVKKRGGT